MTRGVTLLRLRFLHVPCISLYDGLYCGRRDVISGMHTWRRAGVMTQCSKKSNILALRPIMFVYARLSGPILPPRNCLHWVTLCSVRKARNSNGCPILLNARKPRKEHVRTCVFSPLYACVYYCCIAARYELRSKDTKAKKDAELAARDDAFREWVKSALPEFDIDKLSVPGFFSLLLLLSPFRSFFILSLRCPS